MTGWSHGYNISTGYTFGFYRETAPDWIDFALATRGMVSPRSDAGQPFRYLELGSGQGFGLCLLAAANPQGEFVGIDFSPEHTAHAVALAAELKLSNIRFVEGDFAVLGESWPANLGVFDYVVLHGIYSWVPEAIRHSLVSILTAAAQPGAAVYLSYNAMPGWTSTMPFQHMLRLLEEVGAAKGIGAIEAGRKLFEEMEAAGSGLTKALPSLKGRIEGTRKQPEAYLVQEYLHHNWHPMWCSKVMAELGTAKLTLAASATIAENLLPAVLPANLREIIAGRTEPALREDLVDCLINQTFRRDLYVRGPRRRHEGERKWREEFRLWRVNSADIPGEMTVTNSFGTVSLKAAEVAPVLDAIGTEGLSLAELARLPAAQENPGLLNQRVLLLIHGGWLACSRRGPQPVAGVAAVNARLAALTSIGAPYRNFAAANLGSAVTVTDSDMLIFDAYAEDPARLAQDGEAMLRQRLSHLGRKLAKDGKALTGEGETAQIRTLLADFQARTLPMWQTLGVTD